MLITAFTINDWDRAFEGYTNGEHWNGWACPRFNKEVGLKLIEYMKNEAGLNWNHFYDEAHDCFVIARYDDADRTVEFNYHLYMMQADHSRYDDIGELANAMLGEDQIDNYDVYHGYDTVAHGHLYAIGAWFWVWDDLSERNGYEGLKVVTG